MSNPNSAAVGGDKKPESNGEQKPEKSGKPSAKVAVIATRKVGDLTIRVLSDDKRVWKEARDSAGNLVTADVGMGPQ